LIDLVPMETSTREDVAARLKDAARPLGLQSARDRR